MWAVLAGHQPFLEDAEAGELENHYLTTYGSIVHWKGPLGVRGALETKHLFLPYRGLDGLFSGQEDRLWIADPKALYHILHSNDIWGKTVADREINAVLLDRGLLWAEGDVHKRQKKALIPAFGLSEAKALMPRFLLVANKVCEVRRWFPMFPRSIAITLISRFHFACSWSISGRTW